jgi:hypothetical protein
MKQFISLELYSAMTLLVLRLLFLLCADGRFPLPYTCFVACVSREVLTGGVPYDGFTPLHSAIGVVQQSDSAFFTWGVRPEIPLFVPEKLSLLAQQCWHQDPSSSLNSLRC